MLHTQTQTHTRSTHTHTLTGATVTGSLVCKVCAHTSLPASTRLDSTRLEGALDFDRLALGPSLFASLQHGGRGKEGRGTLCKHTAGNIQI